VRWMLRKLDFGFYINISLCISWWNAWPGCLESRQAEPSLSHVVEKNTRQKSNLFSINFTSISSRNIRPKSNLFSINFTLISVGLCGTWFVFDLVCDPT